MPTTWGRDARIGWALTCALLCAACAQEPERRAAAEESTTTAAAVPPASADAAPAPLLGLLRVPEVFGDAPCDRFTPTSISLYRDTTGGSPVGSIAVASPWVHDAAGGCSGLRVGYRVGADSGELRTREIAGEVSAVEVVGVARQAWYRVRLTDTLALWMRSADTSRYRTVESLLPDALTYLTTDWDGRLAAAPGAAPGGSIGVAPSTGPPVRVTAVRAVGDSSWLEVEVLRESPCSGPDNPAVVARGWVPVRSPRGAPTVWFFPRGC